MKAIEVPGCCSLKITHDLAVLGGDDAFSKREAEKFDTLKVKRILGMGQEGIHAGIAIVADECCSGVEKQRAFLRRKGYKMLGKYRVANDFSDHFVYLYGSKEFLKK